MLDASVDWYPDPHNSGQHVLAHIEHEVNAEHLLKSAAQIIDTTYSPIGWREMHVRLFQRSRPDYDRARRVLGALQC